MRLEEIRRILNCEVLSGDEDLEQEVVAGCGADLMSDVLAFTHAGTLLVTGLTNPQVVRTAEMAEIAAIVFVRGKRPPEETIALAEEKGIPLLFSPHTMFEVCGRLYQAGMHGCGRFDL